VTDNDQFDPHQRSRHGFWRGVIWTLVIVAVAWWFWR
jgi:hypothetical protein